MIVLNIGINFTIFSYKNNLRKTKLKVKLEAHFLEIYAQLAFIEI